MLHRIFVTGLACAALLACAPRPPKPVLGASVRVHVVDADLSFRGRVDTGAEVSSIHVTRIELLPSAEGARIRFRIRNEVGASATLERPIADVVSVRTATGSEPRYRVPLTLAIGGIEQRVLVTLRNRGAMRHKLLVGRDLLRGRFVVDVEEP